MGRSGAAPLRLLIPAGICARWIEFVSVGATGASKLSPFGAQSSEHRQKSLCYLLDLLALPAALAEEDYAGGGDGAFGYGDGDEDAVGFHVGVDCEEVRQRDFQ